MKNTNQTSDFTLLTTMRQYQRWARRTFETMPWVPEVWDAEWRDIHKRSRERIASAAPKSFPVLAIDIVTDARYEEVGPLYITVNDARRLLAASESMNTEQ